MAVNIEVRGSRQLRDLGLRLKAAADSGQMRRDMLASIRVAAREAIPDVQESARSNLPKGGGLGERVAEQKYGVRTSLAGKVGGSVRIAAAGMKELRDIDSGKVRHPVYGNRKVWKQQSVEPGFFSKPIEAKAPAIRARILAVMAVVARELAKTP